jgi:hypothetical protein
MPKLEVNNCPFARFIERPILISGKLEISGSRTLPPRTSDGAVVTSEIL